MPSARRWTSAASANSLEAMETAGSPWISNHTVSCRLHVVQDPQSARASTRTLHSALIFSRRSVGQGFVKVGLA